nr:hypothetical protein [Ardenticatena sp.]
MRLALLRSTVDTLFQIDFSWFEKRNISLDVLLHEQLCDQCAREFGDTIPDETLDYVDPNTGEVFQVDPVREAILSHCQWRPDYISNDTPLAVAIFRALLANNNRPMTPKELYQRIRRGSPETILHLLTRGGVKYGIQPVR